MSLCAVILTYNESEHICACIETLRFADSIVVFDSFSTDDTPARAAACGAVVIQRIFRDYADQRNAALEAVRDRAHWILFIDADERVSPELADEIRRVIASSTCAGYRIPRHNYIFGKLTRGAGWFPDYQTRLLRSGRARYDPSRKVHEVVQLDGELGTLEQPLIHLNYRDLRQFLRKQARYTAYEAEVLFDQGVRPRLRNFILQPLRQFKWRFFTLAGYRDGWHGLRLSTLLAYYEWRKYILLRRHWKQLERSPRSLSR
ncbi:MAG: glycosyltransferase family 2 protein [Candidatus Flexifilum sp.]|jgi:glycosyltransferase involved in cell wall biosynthesis